MQRLARREEAQKRAAKRAIRAAAAAAAEKERPEMRNSVMQKMLKILMPSPTPSSVMEESSLDEELQEVEEEEMEEAGEEEKEAKESISDEEEEEEEEDRGPIWKTGIAALPGSYKKATKKRKRTMLMKTFFPVPERRSADFDFPSMLSVKKMWLADGTTGKGKRKFSYGSSSTQSGAGKMSLSLSSEPTEASTEKSDEPQTTQKSQGKKKVWMNVKKKMVQPRKLMAWWGGMAHKSPRQYTVSDPDTRSEETKEPEPEPEPDMVEATSTPSREQAVFWKPGEVSPRAVRPGGEDDDTLESKERKFLERTARHQSRRRSKSEPSRRVRRGMKEEVSGASSDTEYMDSAQGAESLYSSTSGSEYSTTEEGEPEEGSRRSPKGARRRARHKKDAHRRASLDHSGPEKRKSHKKSKLSHALGSSPASLEAEGGIGEDGSPHPGDKAAKKRRRKQRQGPDESEQATKSRSRSADQLGEESERKMSADGHTAMLGAERVPGVGQIVHSR